MNVSEEITLWLIENKMNTIFLVSGGAIIPFMDALCATEDIKLIYNHHEQASVMAAEGWARITGSVGVCLLTVGPGASNGITGLLGAWMDSVPIIVFSGQSFRDQTIRHSKKRQVGIQEIDILQMVKNVTKKSFQLNPNRSISKQLNMALKSAISGRKGPVWIEVPVDVQRKKASYK